MMPLIIIEKEVVNLEGIDVVVPKCINERENQPDRESTITSTHGMEDGWKQR